MYISFRPHNACQLQELLDTFSWDISGHPPCHSDIAPRDVLLFAQLNTEERTFENALDISIRDQFLAVEATPLFYKHNLEKLLLRFNKCQNRNGDYLEKQCTPNYIYMNNFLFIEVILYFIIKWRLFVSGFHRILKTLHDIIEIVLLC